MLQQILSHHDVDENGMPAGGETHGEGIAINWQNGPLGRGPTRQMPNGAFVEGVIAAAIDRLQWYNSTKFKCRENSLAITKLEEALLWLQWRTIQREKRQVEGTNVE